MSASDKIARLRELRVKATAGPWEADDFDVEGGRGRYSAFAVTDAKGRHILDTSNSELQVEHEDDGRRWDEVGANNAAAIVAAMNSLESLLEIARLAQECADDLETEVKSRWVDPDGSIHPALQRKFDRDMSPVIELRAALLRLEECAK